MKMKHQSLLLVAVKYENDLITRFELRNLSGKMASHKTICNFRQVKVSSLFSCHCEWLSATCAAEVC